jgi:hypothetical protein
LLSLLLYLHLHNLNNHLITLLFLAPTHKLTPSSHLHCLLQRNDILLQILHSLLIIPFRVTHTLFYAMLKMREG